MAGISDQDFALASFWEFVKMWKSKAKSRLVFSCQDGQAHVELTADLGAPDHQHVPCPPQLQLRRRKSPAQLRRSERRRQEFQNRKTNLEKDVDSVRKPAEKPEIINVESKKNTTVKVAEVSDAICSDDTYNATLDTTTGKVDSDNERIWTVEGEFHASFPHRKFKEFLEANLVDMIEKSEKFGYWFEDSFTAFFARLKLKPGISKETLLDMSKWPSQVKNVKFSEDYDSD